MKAKFEFTCPESLRGDWKGFVSLQLIVNEHNEVLEVNRIQFPFRYNNKVVNVKTLWRASCTKS